MDYNLPMTLDHHPNRAERERIDLFGIPSVACGWGDVAAAVFAAGGTSNQGKETGAPAADCTCEGNFPAV